MSYGPWFDLLISKMKNVHVDEIFVNGIKSLGILSSQKHEFFDSPFNDRLLMERAMQDFAFSFGLRLDPRSPFAGGFLDSVQYRWHCVLPPAAPEGPIFNLRKHRLSFLGLEHFGMTTDAQKMVECLTNPRSSILICGETGSGKTSLLTALLREMGINQRVILLEEIAEIPLLGPLWARLLSRKIGLEQNDIGYDTCMLFKECLRLRPDRIVFGELRGTETQVFSHALSTGHVGLLATLHAGNIEDVRNILQKYSSQLNGLSDLWVCFLQRGTPPVISAVVPWH